MILSIDPATKTGVTYLKDDVLVSELWDLSTKAATKKMAAEPKPFRLRKMFDRLFDLHKKEGIKAIICEDSQAFSSSKKAAEICNKLIGVIELFSTFYSIPVYLVPPTTLKKHCTGKGNANKDQMIQFANSQGYKGEEDNEADSYCLYIYGIEVLQLTK